MSKLKLFAISFAVTTCVALAFFYFTRTKRPAAPKLQPVAQGLSVTSQLTPENVLALSRRGFRTVVDLRPDGEATDQASSSEIKQAAEQNGMGFHYIPVPHGDIPANAVDELKAALSDRTKPTVLYCRSGNRAVRTLALVEASRADGPGCGDIMKMVRDAGFSADDLKGDIDGRIARRNTAEEAKK